MDGLPIADYALLSDCRSAALVSRDGSVDWLSFPRFDAPLVFCRLLSSAGGHVAIRPAGESRASRRYVDQTMVLETTFSTAGGTAVLTDAMPVGRHERGHDLGARSPNMLLRRLACTSGEIEAEVSYAPRPEYGLVRPFLTQVPGGIAARGGADRLLLSTPVSFDVDGATGRWPARRWPRGPRRRSPAGWRTRWRAGNPGRRFTRTTRVPGGTWCASPAGCSRR
jgi:hypothetical protein